VEGATKGADSTQRVPYDTQAQLLADQLEMDLVAQGVTAADARAIALGALEGSRDEADPGAPQALELINLKSFLPGFLKGALGVAKTIFAGTPIGVASTIVESVVKNFSKKPEAPKEVLATLPAVALDALLDGGKKATPAAGAGTVAGEKASIVRDPKELLVALLASGRGITALPAGVTGGAGGPDAAPSPDALPRRMMELLVQTLAKRTGNDTGLLGQVLPLLQDNLQQRLVGAHTPANLPALVGSVAEGQFAALLGLPSAPQSREALVSLLLERGADALLTKVGVRDDALRASLVQALAQGAARPVQDLVLGKAAQENLLQTLARTLTGTVAALSEQSAPLKKQALEAALLGLSRGIVSTNAVSAVELADVFASVSKALRDGATADALVATTSTPQLPAQRNTPGADALRGTVSAGIATPGAGVAQPATLRELLARALGQASDEELLRILSAAG
jgi:hypothetical protein